LKQDSQSYPKVYLYRRIVQAKLFIDENFSENPDLRNIADEAYFSKFHFTRLFKKIYSQTPHQYLTRVRMEKALQLLQAGVPVQQVCFSVGFESLSSFSGLFKRKIGISPSAYLVQHKQLKNRMQHAPLQFVPGCFTGKNP
jgi:AraC-like DNA-binding protein